jgi:hypothetical protein
MDPQYWRELQLALRADAQAEVDRALKVAVPLQHGLPQKEIRDRLGIDQAALKRLRRISEQLEREELPEEFEGGQTM